MPLPAALANIEQTKLLIFDASVIVVLNESISIKYKELDVNASIGKKMYPDEPWDTFLLPLLSTR